MKRAALAVLLVFSIACDPPAAPKPETVAAKPPTPALEKSPPPAKPETPAPVSLPGTPHDEEHARVSISWSGAPGEVKLAAKPGGTESGKLAVKKGQALKIGETVVLVAEPVIITAKEGAKLFGTTPLDSETEGKDIELDAGTSVGILKYAGEGMCVVKHQAAVLYAGCPSAELFDGDVQARPAADWWIKPEGASGWVLVDKRFKVDVTQGEGE